MSSVSGEQTAAEKRFTIDADFHLQIDMELLYDYVEDDHLRSRLESDGTPPIPFSGGNPFYGREAKISPATTQGAAVTREEITNVMDDWGLDLVTVSPLPNSFMANGRYPVVKKACIRAYHEYVLDRVVDPDAGIYALAIANDFDPEWIAGEIDRIGSETGIVGVTNWVNNDPPMGLYRNDVLWETINAHDLPMVFHQGSGGGRWDTFEQHYEQGERLLSGMYYQVAGNVLNIIMTGLLDKYPEQKIVIQEQGTAWVPFIANQADQLYEEYSEDVQLTERMYNEDRKYLDRKPSDYIYENMWVTTQPIALPQRSDHLEATLKFRRAEDMFMFSSDWPHSTVDTTDWVNHPKISDDLRGRILHKNAEEVFDYASV